MPCNYNKSLGNSATSVLISYYGYPIKLSHHVIYTFHCNLFSYLLIRSFIQDVSRFSLAFARTVFLFSTFFPAIDFTKEIAALRSPRTFSACSHNSQKLSIQFPYPVRYFYFTTFSHIGFCLDLRERHITECERGLKFLDRLRFLARCRLTRGCLTHLHI